MSLWPKIIRIINNNTSLISATDMTLLNNQGWYLDKGWLVHLNQAHCVMQSITRPRLCWKPPSRRLSEATTDSFLWRPHYDIPTIVTAAKEEVKKSFTAQGSYII